MNYPLVTLTRLNGGGLRVSQKRFLSNPSAEDPLKYTSPFGLVWILSYINKYDLPFYYNVIFVKSTNFDSEAGSIMLAVTNKKFTICWSKLPVIFADLLKHINL